MYVRVLRPCTSLHTHITHDVDLSKLRIREIYNKKWPIKIHYQGNGRHKFKLEGIRRKCEELWAEFGKCFWLEVGSKGEKELGHTGSSRTRQRVLSCFAVCWTSLILPLPSCPLVEDDKSWNCFRFHVIQFSVICSLWEIGQNKASVVCGL